MRRADLFGMIVLLGCIAGCGESKPLPTPAQDEETIKKLEELQKQGSQGEKKR